MKINYKKDFKDGYNKIYNIDCVKGMNDIINIKGKNWINTIIADPPFGINYNGHSGAYNRKKRNVIARYVDLEPNKYNAFTKSWLELCYKLLKTDGNIFVVSSWQKAGKNFEILNDLKFHVTNQIIWHYNFGLFTNRKFVNSHYCILYAVKNKKTHKFYKPSNNNKYNYKEMQDVWLIKKEMWRNKQKTSNKLPEQLIKKMLLYTTRKNNIVLDPFMGSGTTAVVSRQLKCKYIGFEQDKKAYNLSKRRLKQQIL